MLGRRAYNLMYRWGAPWDSVGVRPELRHLLDTGVVNATSHPRVVDLGCGSGANVVFLAEQGFRATGIDFSRVALDQARQRAADAGVSSRCRFVEADLTADELPPTDGPFDLLLDFGSIDDLSPAARPAAARLAAHLARPGARFLFWCWSARRDDLAPISFVGPSKVNPGIPPGEEVQLFGTDFEIEPFVDTGLPHTACFLLTRRAPDTNPQGATS